LKYNFDRIQDTDFCCIYSLIDDIIESYIELNEDDDNTVSVIADQYLAQDLFRLISQIEFKDGCRVDFGYVEFDDYEYGDEYIVSLMFDGRLSCEKLRTDNGECLYCEAGLIYIQEDLDSNVFIKMTEYAENNILIFGFDEDDE
jgi:hypothetical protein